MARTSTTVDRDAPAAGAVTSRRTGQQTASDLAFLARAMKAPALLAAATVGARCTVVSTNGTPGSVPCSRRNTTVYTMSSSSRSLLAASTSTLRRSPLSTSTVVSSDRLIRSSIEPNWRR